MIYGVDVSAYQPNFDFAAARRDGIEFALIKATEGSSWKSSYYGAQVNRAQSAGMVWSSYHFLRSDSGMAAQVANVQGLVSPGASVLPDVEWIKDAQGRILSAPTLAQTREFVDRLRDAGYLVPLIYLPQWYWNYWGRPDLTGLPPNWHSRYPDDVVRRKEGFALGAEYWPSFGGIHTEIAQFTSSLAVANYPSGRIDGNAYRGTREQLAALLGGDDMPSAKEIVDELLSRYLEDRRPGVPDGERHHTTVANAFWSTWHTVHYGDQGLPGVAGMYPSNKDVVDAVKAISVALTDEQVAMLGAQLVEHLADRLGIPKQTVLAALTEFYGRAVEPADAAA